MYYVIIINYGIVLLYTIRANGTVVAGALSARGVGAMMTSILLSHSPPAGSRDFLFLCLFWRARCPRDANDNEGFPFTP